MKNLFVALVFIIISCSTSGDKLHFTGIIEGTSVKIPALTGGQIIHLLIDTGIEVQKGQAIAQIDTFELFYQRIQVEGSLEEVVVQQQIASTNLSRAKKEHQYIQKKYQRFASLLKSESVSQQTVDDLRNQLQNAESANQSAIQQYQSLEAKKKQLSAQFKSIQKKIKDATIISPITGIISDKYYEEGEAIPTLVPIAEVIDMNEVWVKIYISEKLLPHVQTGQDVEIKPDGIEESLSGKISWINSKAEFTPKTILTPETRTSLVFAVKILIKNKDRILKHGMPVEVHL
jgi:HlyD family secretion protein